jgi:hypothetical protein
MSFRVHTLRTAALLCIERHERWALFLGPCAMFRRWGRGEVTLVRYEQLPAFGLGPVALLIWATMPSPSAPPGPVG